jgi:hypothetical protein
MQFSSKFLHSTQSCSPLKKEATLKDILKGRGLALLTGAIGAAVTYNPP